MSGSVPGILIEYDQQGTVSRTHGAARVAICLKQLGNEFQVVKVIGWDWFILQGEAFHLTEQVFKGGSKHFDMIRSHRHLAIRAYGDEAAAATVGINRVL